MADYDKYALGGAQFPLTSSTTNTLLQDADPAIFYALDYLQSVLGVGIAARLTAELARSPAITGFAAGGLSSAVYGTLPYDPAPYLQELQQRLPLLALYRISEVWDWKTITWAHRTCEWGLQYVLPPITAAQMERVGPILQAASAILQNRIENMMDPAYQSGAAVWALAGVEEIEIASAKYGRWPSANGNLFFPTWSATLRVKERAMPPAAGAFQTFAGIDLEVDQVSPGAAPIVDVADGQDNFVDPTAIPNLVALYRSDAGLTFGADGSRLGSWANQFGTGGSLAPAAPANQPYVVKAGVIVNNVSKPVLRFDGANYQLSATVSALANDSGQTLVVLFRLGDTARRSLIVGHSQSGDTGLKTIALEANTVSTAGSRYGLFANNSSFDSQAQTDFGNWHVGVIRTANTTGGGTITTATTYEVDGAVLPLTLKSGGGTWSTMAAADQLIVGGNINSLSATAAACDVGVVMAFNAALSDANVATAITYCKEWAGLT